jgi:hypothetical protein
LIHTGLQLGGVLLDHSIPFSLLMRREALLSGRKCSDGREVRRGVYSFRGPVTKSAL